MIRLTFVLRRKPSMSLADFQEYWRTSHGPLVAKHAATLNIVRYVQVHALEDPANQQLASARGKMEPPYDGVAELWWPSREALAENLRSGAGQAAGRELLEDENRFIDLANSPLWLAYEFPQVNPIPEELIAREHSSLVKLFFCLRHAVESDDGGGATLLAHQPWPDDSRRGWGYADATLPAGASFRGRTGTGISQESRNSRPALHRPCRSMV
jgi:uncharacterized protein (TIGR02118 family)